MDETRPWLDAGGVAHTRCQFCGRTTCEHYPRQDPDRQVTQVVITFKDEEQVLELTEMLIRLAIDGWTPGAPARMKYLIENADVIKIN